MRHAFATWTLEGTRVLCAGSHNMPIPNSHRRNQGHRPAADNPARCVARRSRRTSVKRELGLMKSTAILVKSRPRRWAAVACPDPHHCAVDSLCLPPGSLVDATGVSPALASGLSSPFRSRGTCHARSRPISSRDSRQRLCPRCGSPRSVALGGCSRPAQGVIRTEHRCHACATAFWLSPSGGADPRSACAGVSGDDHPAVASDPGTDRAVYHDVRALRGTPHRGLKARLLKRTDN